MTIHIDPCPGCIQRDQEISELQRDLSAKRAHITRLENKLKPTLDPDIEAKVRDVFTYWVAECRDGNQQVKLTTDRAAKIRQRLADGYEVSFIKRAIDGAHHKPTSVNGRVYDDLTLICRDGSHLEDHERRRPSGGTTLLHKLVGT